MSSALVVLSTGCHLVLPLSSSDRADGGTDLLSTDSVAVQEQARADASVGCDWRWRHRLTMLNSGISERLFAFPLLVKLDAGWIDYGEVADDGRDLRFTDADGQPLAHEIEHWQRNDVSYVWVNVPQVDLKAGTVIWLYHGRTGTTSSGPTTAVWDGDFRGVWHMGDSQGAGSVVDSTTNQNHGVSSGAPAFEIDGQVGRAVRFNGGEDCVDMQAPASLGLTSKGTLETWVRFSGSLTKYSHIVGKTLYGGLGQWSYVLSASPNNDALRVGVSHPAGEPSSAHTATSSWTPGKWHYVVGRWDLAGIQIFVDGAPDSAPQQIGGPAIVDPTHRFRIGNGFSDNCNDTLDEDATHGTIDEVRVSAVARSDAWIHAQYLSMTGQLVQYGAQEPSCP